LEVPQNTILTSVDSVVSWCRKYSLWPMPFATACCGIELMAVGASRFDIARFGAEVMRFSPRQCDLLIVAGRVAMKMMPVLQRIWLQMPEPKWCISMGACACTGGVFDTYAVVQGIDRFIPVDCYIPGCPPRPEQILRSLMEMQDKVQRGGTLFGNQGLQADVPFPRAIHLRWNGVTKTVSATGSPVARACSEVMNAHDRRRHPGYRHRPPSGRSPGQKPRRSHQPLGRGRLHHRSLPRQRACLHLQRPPGRIAAAPA
jgi:NADH-quinone oxidoreductase B subunit